jgi:hypothetical protein
VTTSDGQPDNGDGRRIRPTQPRLLEDEAVAYCEDEGYPMQVRNPKAAAAAVLAAFVAGATMVVRKIRRKK